MSSTLYLIDANSIAHWKYYSGVSMEEGILDWCRELSCNIPGVGSNNVIVCLDCSRESNWRKKIFTEYKSKRDSEQKDELLIKNLKDLELYFSKAGFSCVKCEGFEADDLMATFSARYDSGNVVIITSDKDMHQLVDDRISCYDPRPNKKGESVFYGPEEVMSKHGVDPTRFRELLAIAGDAVDGIPGVNGWGKGFAKVAINQTKSRLELIRKAMECKLDGISETRQKSFAAQIEMFNISYELVGLRFDAPVQDMW